MKKKYIILGIVFLILSVIFTVLLTKYDVKAIGPENSSVGFSSLNSKFTFDYNEKVYKISKYLGYVALVIPAFYALIGLSQLIKGKSLSKVDKKLFALAIFYVVVLATYILFEKVVINYRPVILDEGLEASYPSSHTLMSLCFCFSAILMNKELFKDKKVALANVCLFILGTSVVLCRYISGVHWFTDIVGSLLISTTLLMTLKVFVKEQ